MKRQYALELGCPINQGSEFQNWFRNPQLLSSQSSFKLIVKSVSPRNVRGEKCIRPLLDEFKPEASTYRPQILKSPTTYMVWRPVRRVVFKESKHPSVTGNRYGKVSVCFYKAGDRAGEFRWCSHVLQNLK